MSIDLSILPRKHGRDCSVLFSLIQDNNVIAVAEIWHTQSQSPVLEKSFVQEKARRNGLWRFLLEKRLTWLQEHTEAVTVQAYVPKGSPITDKLKNNGFAFADKDENADNRWMIKQLKIS